MCSFLVLILGLPPGLPAGERPMAGGPMKCGKGSVGTQVGTHWPRCCGWSALRGWDSSGSPQFGQRDAEVSNSLDRSSSDDVEEEPSVMDWKIELVAVPVSAVDRAKAFYVDKVGFNADHDHQVNETLRFVQLTPPGSACSISIGTGFTQMKPGSIEGLQMVVPDIEKAHKELTERGVAVSEIEDMPWGKFVYFSDPDGNRWAVQEVPKRN